MRTAVVNVMGILIFFGHSTGCRKSSPASAPESKFELALDSSSCTALPGGSCLVNATVTREPSNATTISGSATTVGVHMDDVALAAGDDQAAIEIHVDATVQSPQRVEFTIAASSETNTSSQIVVVNVEAMPAITVTVLPSAISLSRASSASVVVHIDGGAETDAVDLTSSTPSAGVTVVIAPTGSTDFVVTFSASVDSTIGSQEIVLRGRRGTLQQDASIAVNVLPLQVNGIVRDALGIPVGGAIAAVVGTSGTTTADDGTFSLVDVPVPYDLAVLSPNGSSAVVYMDLNTATVDVMGFVTPSPNAATGSLSGSFSGGVAASSPFVTVAASVQGGRLVASGGTGSYNAPILWYGGTTTVANVHAYQTDGGGAYTGYGEALDVNVAAAASVAGLDIDLGSSVVTTFGITGTISAPTGYAAQVQPWTMWSDGAAFQLPTFSGSAFSVSGFPLFPQATTSLFTLASKSGTGEKTSDLTKVAMSGDTSIALIVPSILLEPLSGTSGVTTSTSFAWQPSAGSAVSLLAIKNLSTVHSLVVVTARTSLSGLPDLSSIGFPLPTSSAMQWAVYNLTDATGITTASALKDYAFQLDRMLPVNLVLGPYVLTNSQGGACLSSRANFTTL